MRHSESLSGAWNFLNSISSLDDVFGKTDSSIEGILFDIGGMNRTMVKSIFISIETIVKFVWYNFDILNKHCIQHVRRSTNGVSFISNAITFYSFRVTESTTCQKEGIYKVRKYYHC